MVGQASTTPYGTAEDPRLGSMRVLVTATSAFAIFGLIGGYTSAVTTTTVPVLGHVAFALSFICFAASPAILFRTGRGTMAVGTLSLGVLTPIVIMPLVTAEGLSSPILMWVGITMLLVGGCFSIRVSLAVLAVVITFLSADYLLLGAGLAAPDTGYAPLLLWWNHVLHASAGLFVGGAGGVMVRRSFGAEESLRAQLLERAEDDLWQKTALVNASPQAIVCCDATSGRIRFLNTIAIDLFGIEGEAAKGLPIDNLLSDQYRSVAPALPILDRLARSRDRGEVIGIDRKGNEIPLEVVVAEDEALREGERWLFLFLRDLRSDRESGANLRRAERQLYDARRLESVGRLAGGVAHDFANILGVITLCAAEIEDQAGAEGEIASDTRLIQDSVSKALHLVEQLSALGANAHHGEGAWDVGEAVGKTEEMLRKSLPSSIEFDADYAHNPLFTHATDTEVERIVMNLVLNARDAVTAEGHIELQVYEGLATAKADTLEDEPPPRSAVIRVRDDGTGIDEKLREELFDPYVTTKPAGEGTGLGLSTVWAIVSRRSGEIDVQSEVGQGTTFEVRLPLVDANWAAADSETPNTSRELLVVEDDPAVRGALATALREQTYQVWEAADVSEALEVLDQRGRRIQLVITDVVLPGQSGVELVQWLSEHQLGDRVIIMSGFIEDVSAEIRDVLPDARFLKKPFRRAELLDLVREEFSDDAGA
jgi:hypothetical protein